MGRYLNHRRCENSNTETIILHAGRFLSDQKDVANAFACYFASVYQKCEQSKYSRINESTNDAIIFIRVAAPEVEMTIKKQSCSMAAGSDNITSSIIKNYAGIIPATLAAIFTDSITFSVYPDS